MEVKFEELLNQEHFRLDPEVIEIALLCLLTISILSQGDFDPAPFNLLWPLSGVENWLGLPGSIIGGSLTFLFGWSALFIPFVFIFFPAKEKVSYWKTPISGLLALLVFTSSFSQLIPDDMVQIRDWTGLWGLTTTQTLINPPGRILCVLITVLYLIRFFIGKAFSPKLFLLISYLFAGLISLSIHTFVLLISFHRWLRGSFNLWLFEQMQKISGKPLLSGQQKSDRSGKGWLSINRKSRTSQKGPLVFYKDLAGSNHSSEQTIEPDLSLNDLKRQEVLQQTLAVLSKKNP
ncbi:MAG: hypothetical protein GY786_07570 [Proteobacteria bacterium]|nr:hypothetical protein [Pseudomonadota bacterium]